MEISGAGWVAIIVCGLLCIVGFVPMVWLFMVGRSGLLFDIIRGGFGMVTGGDPELRGQLRGERRSNRESGDDRVTRRASQRMGLDDYGGGARSRVDDLRAKYDSRFEQRVEGDPGAAAQGGYGGAADPDAGFDADLFDDDSATLDRRRQRRRYSAQDDYDDEMDAYFDDTQLD